MLKNIRVQLPHKSKELEPGKNLLHSTGAKFLISAYRCRNKKARVRSTITLPGGRSFELNSPEGQLILERTLAEGGSRKLAKENSYATHYLSSSKSFLSGSDYERVPGSAISVREPITVGEIAMHLKYNFNRSGKGKKYRDLPNLLEPEIKGNIQKALNVLFSTTNPQTFQAALIWLNQRQLSEIRWEDVLTIRASLGLATLPLLQPLEDERTEGTLGSIR